MLLDLFSPSSWFLGVLLAMAEQHFAQPKQFFLWLRVQSAALLMSTEKMVFPSKQQGCVWGVEQWLWALSPSPVENGNPLSFCREGHSWLRKESCWRMVLSKNWNIFWTWNNWFFQLFSRLKWWNATTWKDPPLTKHRPLYGNLKHFLKCSKGDQCSHG